MRITPRTLYSTCSVVSVLCFVSLVLFIVAAVKFDMAFSKTYVHVQRANEYNVTACEDEYTIDYYMLLDGTCSCLPTKGVKGCGGQAMCKSSAQLDNAVNVKCFAIDIGNCDNDTTAYLNVNLTLNVCSAVRESNSTTQGYYAGTTNICGSSCKFNIAACVLLSITFALAIVNLAALLVVRFKQIGESSYSRSVPS